MLGTHKPATIVGAGQQNEISEPPVSFVTGKA